MAGYDAVFKWRGKKHRVQKHKHARPGMRFPATVQGYEKPNGKKITTRYNQDMMNILRAHNSWLGFWNIRRIGGFLFNQQGNQRWAKKWTKAIGVQARVPATGLPRKGKASEMPLAQGILCDGTRVRVVEERYIAKRKWARIMPTWCRLTEVGIGTGQRFETGLWWYCYPSSKTGQIWVDAENLEKVNYDA